MKINSIVAPSFMRRQLPHTIMRVLTFFLCTTLFGFNVENSFSQDIILIKKSELVTVNQVFKIIKKQSDYRFIYPKKFFKKSPKIQLEKGEIRIVDLLTKSLSTANTSFELLENKTIVIKENTKISLLRPKEISVSQEISVSGLITDQEGLPLPGANIIEKGTANGVQTDFDGNYSLVIKDLNATLVVSYLGYKTQEVPVSNKTTVNISLEEDAAQLEEVVIVGFGTQKKANLTGANSTIDFSETLGDRAIVNSAQALQGSIPGLEININSGSPGAGVSDINIRGFESINGGSPLILMDNVEVNINDINPADIDKVTVLKDAAASAIYGGRAAFGVVLITTKRGKKGTKTKFNYSSSFSISRATELLEQASPLEVATYLLDNRIAEFPTGERPAEWIDLINDFNANPSLYPTGYFEDQGGQIWKLRDNDQVGEFIDNIGVAQIHNVGISGGSESTAYRISLGFNNEDGIMVTDRDSFKRYNLNASIDTDVTDKFSVSFGTQYINSNRSLPQASYNQLRGNPSFYAIGNYIADDGTETPFASAANLARFNVPEVRDQNNIRMTGSLNFKPTKGLKLTGEYTFQTRVDDRRSSNNAFVFQSPFRINSANTPALSSYFRRNNKVVYNAINLYANYEKSFGNHNFSTLVGFNHETNSAETFSASGDNLLNVDLPSLTGTQENPAVNDNFGEWAVQGAFGRFAYNYKEKYLLEVNGRYDGSSRFPRADRFGFFPSFSAGWTVSKENFFKPLLSVVSQLKFRGSWGEVGNQRIEDGNGNQILYPFLSTLGPANANWINPLTGQRYVTLTSPDLVSESFTWERVRSLNFGVDASFFSNRLSTTFDWYKRETLDQLDFGLSLPAALGTGAPLQNVADLENIGWEFALSWKDKIGDFSYRISANVYDSDTEITKLVRDDRLINNLFVGRTIGDIWGYVTDGYYTVDDFVDGTLNTDNTSANFLQGGTLKDGVTSIEGVDSNPGDIKFKDLDGDGIITAGNNTVDLAGTDDDPANVGPGDRKIIGNNRRHFRYGLSGSAAYKGFDFSFTVVGVGERDVNLGSGSLNFPHTGSFSGVLKHQLDYWTPDNPTGFFPRNYDGSGNYGISRRTQTKYLGDGSYWNLRNVSLGFTFPPEALDKTFIDNLRISVSAENPIIKDKLPSGLNSEFDGNGGRYPFQKRFSFGVSLTF